MQLRILFSLFLLLFFALDNVLFAQDFSAQNSKYSPSIYGDKFTYEEDKFYYFNELSGVLFLKGKIEKGMYKDFRQAITDNNIQTLVLDSPGGNVSEGLRIAGTVFDRKIKTYIRKNQNCASACSFIFLSGKTRYTLGKLGVHQIAFDEEFSKKKEEIGLIGEVIQLTNSDIVQYLDENNTPGFVYKYMLRTPSDQMYYFNEDELNQLGNSDISNQDRLHFNRIDNFTKDYNSHLIENKCDTDPKSCTVAQLCIRAAKDGAWRTSLDAVKFVKLAKSMGKRCGVPVPLCPENIKKCNKDYLCTYGTTSMDNVLSWLNNPFADEAKLRGYSCRIVFEKVTKTTSCSQNYKACNRDELCKFATKGYGDNKSWETNINLKKYVEHAKKLSYSCGVDEVTCYESSNKCSNKQLCQVATKNTSKGKEWKNNSYWAKHVTDAKKRGLICGVKKNNNITKKVKCSEDPKQCSNKLVCNYASSFYTKSGPIWVTDPYWSRHVTEAKRRGLSCGVKKQVLKKTCTQDATSCNDLALCKKATTTISGEKSWDKRTSWASYVTEAKRRGLLCGVTSKPIIKKKICVYDTSVCSDITLCKKATRFLNGKKVWDWGSNWYKYKAEAKKRGLSCGVIPPAPAMLNETCDVDPKKCSSIRLCAIATNGNKWETISDFKKYVEEAKLRGLSCGVKKQVSKKTCSQDSNSCNNLALCKKATTTISGEKSWDKRMSWASYVTEAKRRDLSCGVKKKKPIINEMVRSIQKQLNRLGCNAGTADGILGNKTRSALMRWKSVGGNYIPNNINQTLRKELFESRNKCSVNKSSNNLTLAGTWDVIYSLCSSQRYKATLKLSKLTQKEFYATYNAVHGYYSGKAKIQNGIFKISLSGVSGKLTASGFVNKYFNRAQGKDQNGCLFEGNKR